MPLFWFNGKLAVEIADHKGREWTYTLEALPALADERRYAVVRQPADPDGQHCYEVVVERGRWSCDCPAWKYRKRWDRDSCKHCDSVAELDGILRALRGAS